MDASALPMWAQGAGIIAVALVSAIVGVFKYLKTEKPATSSATSQDAAVLDSARLKELAKAISELQESLEREQRRSHRLSQDLRESVNDLNESIIVLTDTVMNLVRYTNRRAAQRVARSQELL